MRPGVRLSLGVPVSANNFSVADAFLFFKKLQTASPQSCVTRGGGFERALLLRFGGFCFVGGARSGSNFGSAFWGRFLGPKRGPPQGVAT